MSLVILRHLIIVEQLQMVVITGNCSGNYQYHNFHNKLIARYT